MLKWCFILLLSCLAIQSNAQRTKLEDLSNEERSAIYHKRAKFNKIMGWTAITLGLGTAAFSYIDYASNDFNGPWNLQPLLYIGSAMVGSGVGFLISAGQNNKKAQLALKGEAMLPQKMMKGRIIPALSLQISLP